MSGDVLGTAEVVNSPSYSQVGYILEVYSPNV